LQAQLDTTKSVRTRLFLGQILQNSHILGIGGIGVIILFILLGVLPNFVDTWVDKKLKGEGRAVRGARAEEDAADVLEVLGEDYFILHDIESPFGNIDHLVFAKSGNIFLIETKLHRGRLKSMGTSYW
jgi:hypothetical protein